MNTEINNDTIAGLIRSNPDLEPVFQHMIKVFNNCTSVFIHELRNPLTVMKSMIQYIEYKHPETKKYKYWSQLEPLLMEMECMMADASTLNLCTSIKKEECNLLDLLQQVTDNFQPQALSKQMDLSLIISEEDESYYRSYYCDSSKIRQVFCNLVKNAMEATNPGDYIHINLGHLPENGSAPAKLSLEFCNNGSLIPEDEIHTIFNPYVTYKDGGTGIGLAIAERVISLHFGQILVSSTEDETCFTILLPL